MVTKNVYLNSKAAYGFSKGIKYDINSIEKIAKISMDYFLEKGQRSLKILDIGVGSGLFTIPFIKCLEREKIDFSLDCFDISLPMLKEIDKKICENPLIEKKVFSFRKDANTGLQDTYEPNTFDIIICTFVLHYIKNWEVLIDDILKSLKLDGIFIQGEIIGYLRNIEGKFDNSSESLEISFWETYFRERNRISEWNPSISVVDLLLVFNYCLKNKKIVKYKDEDYLWKMKAKWKDFCVWIRDGIFSSLGSGLNKSDRLILNNKMKHWLSLKEINLKDKLMLQWGFKITWLMKKN